MAAVKFRELGFEPEPPPQQIAIGVDLGQRHDPTAICVSEAVERLTGKWEIVGRSGDVTHRSEKTEQGYRIRHLERRPLGESYPVQVGRIAEIVDQLTTPARDVFVLVDQTGVGKPVVDILRDQLRDSRARLCGVTITASGRLDGSLLSREAKVGKEWLTSRVKALAATGRIQLPETEEARQLARELSDFEIRVTNKANLISGAFRKGAHDDLVIALALSTLYEPMRARVGHGPSLY